MMYTAYGILFLIDGLYSMYILERKDIPSKPCDLIPANTSLPCRQYMISGDNSDICTENRLRKLFPSLYNRMEEGSFNWPAEVNNMEMKGSSVSWAVTQDGNVHYLKGFQVIQDGNDYNTIGCKQCNVIDLSELTEADLVLLTKVKFDIRNNDSGSYFTEIKPLPLRPENTTSGATVSLGPNKIFEVYHPQINVSIDYSQINASAVNISVTIDGEIEELGIFEIIVTSDGRYLENVAKIYDISQGSFLVTDLTVGTYQVKLTPLDPTLASPCVCYFGTDENRQCANCLGYFQTIQVQQLKESITEEDSMVALILSPILVMSLLFITALSVWYAWSRDKLPSFIKVPASWRRKHSSELTSIEDQLARQPTLRIIYTYDHASHKSAASSLVSLIQNSTKFKIVTDDNEEPTASGVSLLSSENSVNYSVDGAILNTADVICVLHSEWAHKLVSVIGSGEVGKADLTSKEDKNFLSCMNEICQNQVLSSKIVSVRFEYTPDTALIREPFLGPQFNLPENTDAFIKHLHSRTDSTNSNSVNITDKLTLVSSINASFIYQSKHKSWIFSKLFYLRNSPSSDDSAIVIPKRRHLRPKSIRSHSAGSVSYSSFTSDDNSRRTTCNMCYQKQPSRLRTYSCDLSFYPPESSLEGTSERLSLLESKFLDINRRYHQTFGKTNNEGEDCITLDGQSV